MEIRYTQFQDSKANKYYFETSADMVVETEKRKFLSPEMIKSLNEHIHDERYYTEEEIDNKIKNLKEETNQQLQSHTHDNRYYTEREIDDKIENLKECVVNGKDKIANAINDKSNNNQMNKNNTFDELANGIKNIQVNLNSDWTPRGLYECIVDAIISNGVASNILNGSRLVFNYNGCIGYSDYAGQTFNARNDRFKRFEVLRNGFIILVEWEEGTTVQSMASGYGFPTSTKKYLTPLITDKQIYTFGWFNNYYNFGGHALTIKGNYGNGVMSTFKINSTIPIRDGLFYYPPYNRGYYLQYIAPNSNFSVDESFDSKIRVPRQNESNM